jgi:hypothetical protein
MKTHGGLVVLCLMAAGLRPGWSAAPVITLRVEQPAYAGMPVWLDVDVDTPCIGVHYSGDPGGYAEGGRAEVAEPGQADSEPGFKPYNAPHGSLLKMAGACTDGGVRASQGTSRIPLHLVADLRAPGPYAVRWQAQTTTRLGAVAATAWLPFTIRPSTPARRQAWLRQILGHPPADVDALTDTYLPALLAAADDPGVTRRLLDLTCSTDRRVGFSTERMFGPGLSQDGQLYLASLIRKGCLSEGLESYVNRSAGPAFGAFWGGMPEPQRRLMLEATIAALPRARGMDLAHALSIMSQLKAGHDDALATAANAAVLRAVPGILAQGGQGAGATGQPEEALMTYFDGADRTPATDAVLKAVARQPGAAAGHAILRLIDRHDPAYIPFLHDLFMGYADEVDALPDTHGAAGPTREFDAIPKLFGAPGTALLRSLLHAPSVRVRAAASVALAKIGDQHGMGALIAALQSDRATDRVELLMRLRGTGACPQDDHRCGRMVTGEGDIDSPWLLARKAMAIEYFEDRLKRND